MKPFEFPSYEGAKEIAPLLGVSPADVTEGQDWEYTYPKLSDLSIYWQIYDMPVTSNFAKRVLGCFIFQCLEEHLSTGGSEDLVHDSLSRLLHDYSIHKNEFEYWSLQDDDHYATNPEDGWHIMNLVRQHMATGEQIDDTNSYFSGV